MRIVTMEGENVRTFYKKSFKRPGLHDIHGVHYTIYHS